MSAAAPAALPKGQQEVLSVCPSVHPQGPRSHAGGAGGEVGAFVLCPMRSKSVARVGLCPRVGVHTKQCQAEGRLI